MNMLDLGLDDHRLVFTNLLIYKGLSFLKKSCLWTLSAPFLIMLKGVIHPNMKILYSNC